MRDNMREFLNKVKENSTVKCKSLSFVGGCIVAVGIVGFIPSTILSMPFVVESLAAAEKRAEKTVTSTIKLDKIEDVKLLELNTVDGYRLNNVYIDKSEKGYSYINIIAASNVDATASLKLKDDGILVVDFQSTIKDYEEKKLTKGMSATEVIDVVSNDFIGNANELYNVEVYLDKPLEIDLGEQKDYIEIKDGSMIKSLISGTSNIYFKEKEMLEKLVIDDSRGQFNINTDILNNAKNIEVKGDIIYVNGDKSLESTPKSLTLKARSIDVTSDYEIAENFNIDAYDTLYLNRDASAIINSKSIDEINHTGNEEKVDWKNSKLVVEEYSGIYRLNGAENSFSIRERAGSLKINIINHLNELIIQ
ncbi:MAG: hypothetical protein ACRC6T_12065 [Sarcina sp.]